MTKRVNNNRYDILDALRGLTVCSMVVYHMTWDLVCLYGVNWPWFLGTAASVWQQSICWTFLLLSGFCWSLGHHPLKNGIKVSAAGAVVTMVTVLFMPEEPIWFGVLTLLGAAMLFLIPADRLLSRISPSVGLFVCGLIFVLTRNLKDGAFSFGTVIFFPAPKAWYRNLFTAFLGCIPDGFYSADYFPIFPWLFLFLAGYFLYQLWKPFGKLPQGDAAVLAPFRFIGKHSLPIYLIHQPIVYGICEILHGLGMP